MILNRGEKRQNGDMHFSGLIEVLSRHNPFEPARESAKLFDDLRGRARNHGYTKAPILMAI